MSASLSPRLARLIAGQICLHAGMAGTRMAAPLLALKLDYSPLAVGFLLALFALSQVFLALPAGRFADRHGLLKPVGWSVFSACLAGTAAAAFPVFAVLCLSALLMGAATGTTVIALQRHVGRAAESPIQLKQVFSWLSIGPAASNFLGPVVAGLLIDHAGPVQGDLWGFRAAFLMMALLPVATWFWVRGTPELPPVELHTGKPKRAWDLLRQPMFRRLLVVNWLLSACWDVHTFVVPLLGHERGYSASVIGAILGTFAMAAVAVRIVLPLVASHLREWKVVTGAMLTTTAVFAVYPLLPSPWLMGCFSVLLGLSLGTVQPVIMSTLHQITPDSRHGEALGLRLMAINASSVLMPMLFGVAGAAIGVASVFWMAGAAVGLGAPQAWRLRPPRGREGEGVDLSQVDEELSPVDKNL
jgi:MFS family permease